MSEITLSGGFETGLEGWQPSEGFYTASISRQTSAARTGSWGLRATTAVNSGSLIKMLPPDAAKSSIYFSCYVRMTPGTGLSSPSNMWGARILVGFLRQSGGSSSTGDQHIPDRSRVRLSAVDHNWRLLECEIPYPRIDSSTGNPTLWDFVSVNLSDKNTSADIDNWVIRYTPVTTSTYCKDGGIWKPSEKFVKHNGIWKPAETKVRHAGLWKDV